MLRGGLLATHLAGRRSLVRQLRGSSSGRQFAGGGAGARAARAVGDGRWWLLAAPPSLGRRHGHGRGRRLRTRTQTKREAGRGPSGQSLPSDSRMGSGPARSSHQVNLGRCGNLTKLHYLSQLLGGSLVQERSTHRDAVGITSSTEAPQRRSLAPIDSIRQMRRAEGLLVYGHLRPARLRLRLSWRDRRLRRLAAAQAPIHRTSPGMDERTADADGRRERLVGRKPRTMTTPPAVDRERGHG
jgi:hypothetical protein